MRIFNTYKSILKPKGFTIIEAIVAIFIITVGAVGAIGLTINNLSLAGSSSRKLVAAYLAQEGIEIIRNIRDTNWLEQLDPTGNPLNPWYENLDNCQPPPVGVGCIADYKNTTEQEPTLGAYTGQSLKIDPDSGLYNNSPTGDDSPFQRKITIDNSLLPDQLRVSVLVQWLEKGITQQITAEEILYKWRQ